MLGIRFILVMQLELRMDFYMIILFELIFDIKLGMLVLTNMNFELEIKLKLVVDIKMLKRDSNLMLHSYDQLNSVAISYEFMQMKRSMVILGNSADSLMILEQTIMNELMMQIFLKKLTMQERLDLIERHD